MKQLTAAKEMQAKEAASRRKRRARTSARRSRAIGASTWRGATGKSIHLERATATTPAAGGPARDDCEGRELPSRDADAERWREHGDLTRAAFDLAFKGFWLGYVTKESVKRGAELLKRELGYEGGQAAERVLIDHAVLCHVRLGMVEHLYSRQTSGSYGIAQGEHWEKRLTPGATPLHAGRDGARTGAGALGPRGGVAPGGLGREHAGGALSPEGYGVSS